MTLATLRMLTQELKRDRDVLLVIGRGVRRPCLWDDTMRPFHSRILVATLPFLLAAPYAAAQPAQTPTRAEAEAALNPAPAPMTYSNAQLDQMLAPIALYPDQLLTQLLMASTFPDQLVDAQKWLQDPRNAALKGDDLVNAVEPLPWDPSVKSLVAFPQIIAMMVDHLDWTEALGTAFANQEVAVFARVQFLRDRAKQAGKLKSTAQLAVREQDSDIVIEPADPNTIYVPVYNPAEIYGDWPDRAAPPVYLPPPPNFYSGAVGAAIGFSVGFGVVHPLWGWGHPDWHRHTVIVDPGRYRQITKETVIQQNHITVRNGEWHRGGPVNYVPEGRRPSPPARGGEHPAGTIRPSELSHAGPGPGHEQPPHRPGSGARPAEAPGPQPSGRQEAQPGQHPEPAQPGGHARPGEEAHPEQHHEQGHGPGGVNEAHPGQPHPQDQHPGQPNPQEEHRGQPHPSGAQPGQPNPQEEHPGQPHPPGAQPGQPNPQDEHRGQPHPQEAQPGQPHPQEEHRGQPHPQDEHPGQAHPQEQHSGPHQDQPHAAQPGPQAQPRPPEGAHPEPHGEAPHQPANEAHPASQQQPHPPEAHPEPAPQQQPHAAPPQPQPQPQAHPAPPQGGHPPQGPQPGQQHQGGPQPGQSHQGGPPQGGDKKPDRPGGDDKH